MVVQYKIQDVLLYVLLDVVEENCESYSDADVGDGLLWMSKQNAEEILKVETRWSGSR